MSTNKFMIFAETMGFTDPGYRPDSARHTTGLAEIGTDDTEIVITLFEGQHGKPHPAQTGAIRMTDPSDDMFAAVLHAIVTNLETLD